MGFPRHDFGSLVQALYGIEKGISRGLWAILPLRLKGKKGSARALGCWYYWHDRHLTVAPIRPMGPTYLHPPPQVYTTQHPEAAYAFHHQDRAPPPPRPGLVDLGRPGVATDPLPTHDTRAVPPPREGQQISRPFSLTPDKIYGPPPVSPIYLQHVPPRTPFILPEEYRPLTRSAREEVQREDDEILRQLRTTQARISIWSLLASSSTHRDALVRALGQIRVDTATTPEGLIHMLTADRATCRRVSSILLDNGSALNVCPLVTAIALGFSPDDFGPSTQTVRAYDGTQRTVMGTLSTHVMIGPVSYSIVFQVLRIQSSFNLLLGCPWIHEAMLYHLPSSKVKFIHEGTLSRYDRYRYYHCRANITYRHGEDGLHLTGFTFDEVQVVGLEDGGRDMVPMSFDQTRLWCSA
ncbi:hypothetical protein AAG906_026430 [Vitis piasezkii]